jgi:uncharacterized integral membrane protein
MRRGIMPAAHRPPSPARRAIVAQMSTPEQQPSPSSGRAAKSIAALVVAGLLIAFGVANDSKVSVDWLVTTTSTSLILVILVSAVLGAILGGLGVRRISRRGSREVTRRASRPG